MKKIILFGDSITAGYKHGEINVILNDKIRHLLPYEAEIINAGIPGDTTSGAMKRVMDHVVGYEPDMVTVFFGTNDVAALSGISLAQYETNLMNLVEVIGSDRVILLGPPFANQVLYQQERPLLRLNQYNQAARRVAAYYELPYIDMLSVMTDAERPVDYLQADGLHFSTTGYDLLARVIVEQLKGRS